MSARHYARTMPFADLAAALADAVRDGAVNARRCAARPGLVLYVYSQRCVYENLWTPVIETARGLVLDHDAGRVLATPFPKFFNLGERPGALPDEPFEALDKLDGSLGVVYHDGEGWRCSTKGGFESAQAQWAQRWLDARDLSPLTIGTTYCFEIIYSANRIVVRYPFEGLVLLAAYDEAGEERSRVDLLLSLIHISEPTRPY